ncbi:hypothetical protein M3Y94_01078700 [Aphelenchoides besseyi]|nr:hypothetical protein M3Y94_01078700 [Aphelenchoides besseyi]
MEFDSTKQLKCIENGGRLTTTNGVHFYCDFSFCYSQDGRFVYLVRHNYSMVIVYDSWLSCKRLYYNCGVIGSNPIIFALDINRIALLYYENGRLPTICIHTINFEEKTMTSEVTTLDFEFPRYVSNPSVWRTEQEDQYMICVGTNLYSITNKTFQFLHRFDNSCGMCAFHFNSASARLYIFCQLSITHSKTYAVDFTGTEIQFVELQMDDELKEKWEGKKNLLRWSHTFEGSNLYAVVQHKPNIVLSQPASAPQLHILNLDTGESDCYALNSCNQTLNNAVLKVFDGYLTIHSNVNERDQPWITGLYALKKPETLLNLAFFNCSPTVKADPKYASLMRPFLF